jgi:hypothetical protein
MHAGRNAVRVSGTLREFSNDDAVNEYLEWSA